MHWPGAPINMATIMAVVTESLQLANLGTAAGSTLNALCLKNGQCKIIHSIYISLLPYLTVNNGSWSQWGTWSGCTRSCGTGLQTRVRSCSNPPPSEGGSDCQGIGVESRPCNIKDCPGKQTISKPKIKHCQFPTTVFHSN